MSNMSRGRKLPDAKPMTAETNNAAKQLGVKAKSMTATETDTPLKGKAMADKMLKRENRPSTKVKLKPPPKAKPKRIK